MYRDITPLMENQMEKIIENEMETCKPYKYIEIPTGLNPDQAEDMRVKVKDAIPSLMDLFQALDKEKGWAVGRVNLGHGTESS